MSNNEFSSSIFIDFAPVDSTCQWCGKAADEQLTAIGGIHHNESGSFCYECGREFIRMVRGERTTVNPDILELLVGLD